MDLAQFLDLMRQHGSAVYGFLFVAAATNSLLVPLIAGYAAHAADISWLAVTATCWAGSLAGDAVRFWIGRRFGTQLVRRFARLQRAALLVDRHFRWMVLVHRYPQGLRNLAGLAFGMSSITWARFLALNAISAAIWAVVVVSAGYLFGHVLESALGDAASKVGIAALAVFALIAWLLSRSLAQAAPQK
jgi:membrane protein DedA with SNARE-associated domain